MASFIRFIAAIACLLAGGVVGALNPQSIVLDLGFATLRTSLGLGVLQQSAFWWAMATLPLLGAINVSVSFYLAFLLALRAQNVSGVERTRLYAAIRSRLRTAPLSFFLPSRQAS